jgi:hypothetical protein
LCLLPLWPRCTLCLLPWWPWYKLCLSMIYLMVAAMVTNIWRQNMCIYDDVTLQKVRTNANSIHDVCSNWSWTAYDWL